MLFRRKDNVRHTTIEAERVALRLRVYRMLRNVMWLSLSLAFFAGGVELRRFLVTTPLLALRTLEVSGNDRVTAWEVRVLGDIQDGQNVLGIDLAATAKQIKRHPWIADVRLRRILPDRIQVEITEREPMALLAAGSLYYVDRNGVIFKRVRPGEDLGYPVLTGFDQPGPLQQGSIGRKAIQESLDLLELVMARTPLTQDQISEVHLDPTVGWSLYTGQAGAQIHLGWESFDRKLERLKKLLEQERLDLAQVRRIDMDLKKWAVVTPM